jgi:hypothetical protein
MSHPPSLLKQILGAIGGAAIALAIYGGYKAATPKLSALTILPPAVRTASESFRPAASEFPSDQYDRVSRRTREILERFDTNPAVEVPPTTEEKDPIEEEQKIDDPLLDFQVIAPKREVPEEVVEEDHAPNLPSSGVGVWTSAILALLFALGWRFNLLGKKQRVN